MQDRRWLPANYQDEIIPTPRKYPNHWIVALPGDVYALAPCNDDDDIPCDPELLHDGDIVLFDWTEDGGTAEFTVNSDGSWESDIPEPETPPGSAICVSLQYDNEMIGDSLENFASFFTEDGISAGTYTIVFYFWSINSVNFVFRAGQFHPVETAS